MARQRSYDDDMKPTPAGGGTTNEPGLGIAAMPRRYVHLKI